MTLGLKCLFCAQPATIKIRIQVFGHEGVIYFCEQHRENAVSRGFRLEDDQN
jgi:hypothetical protein